MVHKKAFFEILFPVENFKKFVIKRIMILFNNKPVLLYSSAFVCVRMIWNINHYIHLPIVLSFYFCPFE